MGNRAVITTQDKELGVYLHWNGGRDSIDAFLTYCKLKGYRTPETDCYGWARLCQVIGNFFGGEYSVGIDKYDKLDTDNGDNGTYIIKNWEIIDKEFEPLDDSNEEQFTNMLYEINVRQPQSEQLDTDILDEAIKEKFTKTISAKQIKAIHAVAKELSITDTQYRQLLKILFNVSTCKDLTEQQASILIETLNKIKG